MPNGDGSKKGKKTDRSNRKKKNNFTRAAHFFVHFFAAVKQPTFGDATTGFPTK